MVNFEIATHKDIQVLALLGRITYIESHAHFINNKEDLFEFCNNEFSVANISKSFKENNVIYFIAYLNKLPVGYAKIALNKTFNNISNKDSCSLEKIYILSDFIPNKIGQPFLEYIIEQAKLYKASSIWLSVYHKNERAIKFYKKNNFVKIGELNFIVNNKKYNNLAFAKHF